MTPAQRNRITVDWRARPMGWWHAEAKRMLADGMSKRQIGLFFGVTPGAVTFAVDDDARLAGIARAKARNARLREARS